MAGKDISYYTKSKVQNSQEVFLRLALPQKTFIFEHHAKKGFCLEQQSAKTLKPKQNVVILSGSQCNQLSTFTTCSWRMNSKSMSQNNLKCICKFLLMVCYF